jgi:hypothetical protein
MIEVHISKLVEAHYHPENAEILLLSNLGERLIKEGMWPLERGDKRTLYQVAEAAPGVSIVTDPRLQAFIALVKEGDEQRARDEIEKRCKLAFLRGLPSALLHAFTAEAAPGIDVWMSLVPKAHYRTATVAPGQGFYKIDDELRSPGLDVTDVDALAELERERLEFNIREWAARHQVDLKTLGRRRRVARETLAKPVEEAAATALDRLYAAQAMDVAKRMTIPIDIAVALSRLP